MREDNTQDTLMIHVYKALNWKFPPAITWLNGKTRLQAKYWKKKLQKAALEKLTWKFPLLKRIFRYASRFNKILKLNSPNNPDNFRQISDILCPVETDRFKKPAW